MKDMDLIMPVFRFRPASPDIAANSASLKTGEQADVEIVRW